jgi:hypothetical protein
LEQLEVDFRDKYAVGGTENQYEKQKNLLLSVLPKPKSLDEISISPNHEFVHQFDLGTVEKDRWNPNSRQTETVLCRIILPKSLKISWELCRVTLCRFFFVGSPKFCGQ